MICFGVDSENVGDVISEVIVVGGKVGIVNDNVEIDFVSVDVDGHADVTDFVVVCGVVVLVCEVMCVLVLKAASPAVSAAVSDALIGSGEVIGEGVGDVTVSAHFVVIVGVVGMRYIVGVVVGEGVGGMAAAAAAHLVVVAGVVESL